MCDEPPIGSFVVSVVASSLPPCDEPDAAFALATDDTDAAAVFSRISALRAALYHHPAASTRASAASLDGVARLLAREVSSLRSAVSRNALHALGELARVGFFRGAQDAVFAALVGGLVTKAVNDKRFIRDVAVGALESLVFAEAGGAVRPASPRLLFQLLTYSKTKNRGIALTTARLVSLCVKAWLEGGSRRPVPSPPPLPFQGPHPPPVE